MTLVEKYINRLNEAVTLSEINDIVDESAGDNGLSNGEYEEVYTESLRIVHGWWN